MVSGNSYKPGDVIGSASGKTIEVKDTDAEGRIVLADALDYASRQKPDEIIDFVRLSKEQPIAVRFIEEMPFNGKGQRATEETWDYTHIFNHIKNNFSDFFIDE